MIEKYEGIKMEVITFDTEDILTTSGGEPNESGGDSNEGELD